MGLEPALVAFGASCTTTVLATTQRHYLQSRFSMNYLPFSFLSAHAMQLLHSMIKHIV